MSRNNNTLTLLFLMSSITHLQRFHFYLQVAKLKDYYLFPLWIFKISPGQGVVW